MHHASHVHRVASRLFGRLPDGQAVMLYTLANASGIEVDVIDLGGIIVSLRAPDREGRLADIVLGFDSPTQYLDDKLYFGALLGRFANRIANGRFTLDQRTYQLPINNGVNALHGGDVGFDKRRWSVQPIESTAHVGLVLSLCSDDGDQGYPGTLHAEVSYVLDDNGALTVKYRAQTDKPTIVNMTQHAYFNLQGHDAGEILGHEITLNAQYFTPTNDALIPTGEIAPVANTAMDFAAPKCIGADIQQANQQLNYAGGYDHYWVLNRDTENQVEPAATAYDPVSGRFLEIATDQPGLFFYTGNFLGDSTMGKEGCAYVRRGGFTLEPQRFPDSPNQTHFPSPVLRPGELYTHTSIYRFSTQ